jgi:hypothetical protein
METEDDADRVIKGDSFMNTEKINSTELSRLSATTKDLINMGMWFLYEVDYAKFPEAKYFLSAERKYYFLKKDGEIIAPMSEYPADLEYDVRILFNDLPAQESLSNYKLSWAY